MHLRPVKGNFHVIPAAFFCTSKPCNSCASSMLDFLRRSLELNEKSAVLMISKGMVYARKLNIVLFGAHTINLNKYRNKVTFETFEIFMKST